MQHLSAGMKTEILQPKSVEGHIFAAKAKSYELYQNRYAGKEKIPPLFISIL